jgi:Chaperone of endosialidase
MLPFSTMKPFLCLVIGGILASYGCDSTPLGHGPGGRGGNGVAGSGTAGTGVASGGAGGERGTGGAAGAGGNGGQAGRAGGSGTGGGAGGRGGRGASAGGGSAGAAGGRGGGAAGQGGGTAGAGGARSCGPAASCPSCTTGACCGTSCCAPGEWCDNTGAAPACRCGSNAACTGGNMCASGGPAPVDGTATCGFTCCGGSVGSPCPISRRVFKRDIERLDQSDLARIYDELRKIQLSTYHYKTDPSGTPRHLGFIIDDTKTPYPINADGMSVDLYGYMSMSVAAIQIQSREIEALRAEIAALREAKARPAKHR